MKVNLGIWSKLSWAAIVLAIVAGLMLVVVWYLPLVKTNERMRKEILTLSVQVEKEEKTSRELKASIEAIRHDSNTVARLARERLGYAKPGETVIRFEGAAVGNSASN